MKELVSIKDIKEAAQTGKKVLMIGANTIITPLAKDTAAELGVTISYDCGKRGSADEVDLDEKNDTETINIDMIYKIVKEILQKSFPACNDDANKFEKQCDSSGLQLIKSETVTCEPFETGNPDEKIGMMDIVSVEESPHMGAGFMTLDHCDFNWELTYEEFDYIVEGDLNITINGKTYRGKQGDVFYIPKNSKITWNTPNFARIFYTTYPANWAELAAAK